jgi:hypothetical protein
LGLRYCETNNRSEKNFGADTKTVRTFIYRKDRKKHASFIAKTPRRKYGVWATRAEPWNVPALTEPGDGAPRYQNFLPGFFSAGA